MDRERDRENGFRLVISGHVCASELIIATLDEAILENENHTYVKNQLLDTLGKVEKTFDVFLNTEDGKSLLGIDLEGDPEKERRLFVAGYERALKNYLTSLTP